MTLKIWLLFIALVVSIWAGTHAYDLYVSKMPHHVWRFSVTIWAVWAGWHSIRAITS